MYGLDLASMRLNGQYIKVQSAMQNVGSGGGHLATDDSRAPAYYTIFTVQSSLKISDNQSAPRH